MSARAAAACWLTAGVAYVGLEAVAAHALPGYGYAHDFISDLGRPDSPLHPAMNAAFVIQGTLFATGATLLVRAAGRRGARAFLACAAANAVGNVVVASVPSGSAGTQWLHVTGAVLAIVGGNAAILAGQKSVSTRRWYRSASTGIATVGLLSFVLLAVDSVSPGSAIGSGAVWERTSVYTIIAWQMLSALLLLKRSRD